MKYVIGYLVFFAVFTIIALLRAKNYNGDDF